jgi:hypothetical protein
VAGNATISATPAVNIDKTPPTVSFRAPSPAPNAAGWNNTNVSIPFTLADNASGVASSSTPSPLLLTSEGMGITGAVTATDIAGNSKTYTSPAVKIDKTPPTVVIASPLNGSTYRLNSSITASYTCADGLSGITGCAGTQANGATFAATPVGSKTFVVSATDAAGNTTGVTNMYTVAYTLLGFFTPLATVGSPAAPTDSGTFNLGKAIPVKWQLTDANGSPQVDLATLVNLQAISNPLCKGAPPPGATSILLYNPTSGATGGSTFRIDASGSQYIFNWDTSSVPATGCYNLVAQLNDTKAYATIVHLQ